MADVSAQDLKDLAQARLLDARLLLQNGRHSAAYYLAGYVVEMTLKACIARQFRSGVLPDLKLVRETYSRDLDKLLMLARLRLQFDEARKLDTRLSANWAIVSNWSVESRYELVDPVKAVAMVNAVAEEPSEVFQWLQKHW
ncbi:MAG: HEPN domain-containing protein [Hyphomicrobiaceae bacterium]|nr:HEPN domain-containing protein [Hyphomicrobiaceae bacterium]